VGFKAFLASLEAVEVDPKVDMAVEEPKGLTEVDTRIKTTATASIREALKYNNNQTYLAKW
jgi:hypothetical protein